jgi:hypothetical protein
MEEEGRRAAHVKVSSHTIAWRDSGIPIIMPVIDAFGFISAKMTRLVFYHHCTLATIIS